MNIITDIVTKIRYASVATSSLSGQPWNAPVYYVFDKELNFYWFSDTEAVHSQDIDKTGYAFLAVFDSTVPEGQGRGLQMECTAARSEDAQEVHEIVELYNTFTQVFKIQAEDMIGDSPTRLYKAVPQHIWTNSDAEKHGHYVDVREEITI